MPRIKDYTSQVSSYKPTQGRQSLPEDFGDWRGLAEAGAGIQDLASGVEKAAARAEVSDLYAKMSKVHSDYTTGLSSEIASADPADKEFAQKFVDKFDEQMSTVGEDISTNAGRQFFAKTSAAYRSHFYEAAVAGQAQLAGTKAVADYQSSLDYMSSTLVNDPSSFDLVKEQHEDFLKSGAIPAEAQIKLKASGDEKLAKAALMGWINLNPQNAKEQIQSGQWDKEIDGQAKVQMLAHADQGIRAKDAEAERIRRKEAEALAKAQMETQNGFLEKLVSGDLNNKDILNSNLDPFGSGSKEQFIKLLEASNKKDLKTDPAVFSDLFERIHLPDGDPKKILDENQINQSVVNHQLSFEDAVRLRGEVQGKRTQEGSIELEMKKQLLNVAKAELVKTNPALGLKDPDGETNYLQYLRYVDDTYTQKRKDGVPALDLFDPSSKDYLGAALPQFKRSLQDQVKSLANSANPPKTPGAPDPALYRQVFPSGQKETIVEWRKRTGGKR